MGRVTAVLRPYKSGRLVMMACVIAVVAQFSHSNIAFATNPGFMSFQGKVVNADGTNVTNGTYTFDFVMYDDSSLGSPSDGVHDKWHELSKSVTVTNGVFQTNLGSATALPDFNTNSSLYLAVRFNSDAAGYMSPRVQMGSVPYALNADKVGGVAASNIVQLGATQSGNINISSGTITSGLINGQTISSSANFTGTLNVLGASALTLGTASTNSGAIIFKSLGGVNTVTFQGPDTNPGSSYVLKLPATAPSLSQCLQNDGTTIGQLIFSSCSASGVTSIGAVDTVPTQANGARISSNALILQYADGTYPGLVSTTIQTFAGAKTFSGVITANAGVSLGSNQTINFSSTGSRPGSPSDGVVYYDSTTKQLLTYANSKWQGTKSGANKFVAAFNSTQTDKDLADYVVPNAEDSVGSGIGTTDGAQISINSALSAVSSAGGGTVYLLPGTYTIDASISIPNNVTLAGYGNSTLVQLGNFGATLVNITLIANSDTSTGAGIAIRDLKIDGRKSINTSGQQIAISMTGVGSSSLTSATVMNVSINNVSTTGMQLVTTVGARITNNQFTNASSAVYIGTSASANTVTGNRFINNSNAVAIVAGTNNTVISNTITGSSSDGVYIQGGTYNTVTGNVITGGSSTGVNLALSANFNTISDNIITSNATGGILTQVTSTNNTIDANKIGNNGGATTNEGISISTDLNIITNNEITDSSCTTSCKAINISSGTKNYLSNNHFIGNGSNSAVLVNSGTTTIFSGQQTNSSLGSDVTDFAFRGSSNSSTGFMVQNSSGTSILNVDTSTNLTTLAGSLTVQGTSLSLGNGSAVTISTPSGNAAINITPNGAGQLNLGTSNTGAVGLGNTTGALTIRGGGTSTISNTSGNLTISTLTSGTLALDSVAALSIGATNATSILVGSTSLSGASAITLGQSTATNTISIGNINTATGNTQTINIGAGTPVGTGLMNVTIGSLASTASTTVLQGGGAASTLVLQTAANGGIDIGANNVASKTVNIGSVNATAQTSTVHIADSTAAAQTVSIGSISGAGALNLKSGTGNINISTGGGGDVIYSQAAGSNAQFNASAPPTVDQVSITNTGQGVTTSGVNGLALNYTGGNAAVEASGERIDLTPGGTSGGTWSGLRIVANGTGPVSGVTEYGIKIEGPTSAGAGTETGVYIGTGWDTGLNVQSGGLNLAGYTSGGSPADPATPAAGNLAVYSKLVSGRMLLKFKGPSGVDSAFQPALFGNNIVLFSPGTGATITANANGFGTSWTKGSSTGTASTPTPATTAPAISNQMHRFRHQNLVTTTNQIMGVQIGATDGNQFWMGNAAGLGGFFFTSRFIVEAFPAATVRIFSGLTSNASSTAVGTNIVTADAVVGDVAGLWHDTTDANTRFNFVTRNNVTTTKTAITLSNAIVAGSSYDFFMFVKPNDTTIYYRLDDIVNGVTYEGSTSTTVPRNTIFMGPVTEMSNGTANVTVGTTAIGINRIYVESDH